MRGPFARALAFVLLSGISGAVPPVRDGVHLEAGRSHPVAFRRGTTTTFLIECARDDVFRVTVRRPAPFVIAVVDPAGATVRTRAKVEPLDGPETVTVVANVAGLYRVELRARGGPDARGGHEIRLAEHRPARSDDLRRAEAELLLEQADALRARSTAAASRQALGAYERARAAWLALGDPRGEADAVLGAGLSSRALADNQRALEAYIESLGARRASGDLFGEAFTLQNIAIVHRTWGDLAAAEAFYAQARDVAGRHGDERALADALNGLARVAAELGDVQRSLDLSAEAWPRSAAIGDRRGEAYALTAIGNAHFYAGDLGRAREFYRRVLDLRRALDEPFGEANALANLGAVAIAEGDAADALARGREGLAIVKVLGNRRAEAEQLHVIGLGHQLRGAHAEAVAALQESASINAGAGDRRHEAVAREPLAVSLMALGRMREAREAASRALELRRGLGDVLGEAQGLAALADVEAAAGNLPAAGRSAAAALDAFDSLRVRMNSQRLRATFVAAARRAYERSIDVQMRLAAGDVSSPFVTAAFHASERARARGLLDALADVQTGLSDEIEWPLRQLEREAHRKVDLAAAALASLSSGGPSRLTRAEAESALDEATFQYELVEARIRAAHPRLAALTHATPLTLAEVQRDVLDEESLLLEYALGTERSYVWAITKRSVRAVALPDRATIDRAARAVHETAQASHRPGRGAAARLAAAEMSLLILAPVGDLLGDRRLLIVPDGALHVVPFPVLPRPGATARAPLGAPLIDRHEVVVLPSASVVPVVRAAARARPEADRPLAVFADPVFRHDDPRLGPNGLARPTAGSSFERLPFARREAERIVDIVGASHSTHLATDFEASRDAVLSSSLRRYRIVHFATHALVDTRRPSFSGIVLSLVTRQGEPQDGFLRLRDVYGLRLGASLVVLSACQTALGEQIHGEGVVGLTRGFMHAGVPSVVASLWDVRDEQTAELMTRFYERLLRDRMPPAAALRAAQRSMLADPRLSAPSHWAGFVLHGDWRPS